jgi:hypothetical protein
MPAYLEYSWDFIAGGATVSVYIHGYPANMATVYSATLIPVKVDGMNLPYSPSCVLTQGYFYQHVDHTQARQVWVRNTSLATWEQPGAQAFPVSVDLYTLYDIA